MRTKCSLPSSSFRPPRLVSMSRVVSSYKQVNNGRHPHSPFPRPARTPTQNSLERLLRPHRCTRTHLSEVSLSTRLTTRQCSSSNLETGPTLPVPTLSHPFLRNDCRGRTHKKLRKPRRRRTFRPSAIGQYARSTSSVDFRTKHVFGSSRARLWEADRMSRRRKVAEILDEGNGIVR